MDSITAAMTDPLYPWLQPSWQKLLQLQQGNALPHALLLQGAEGIGKASLAQALAEYVLCQQPLNTGACGQCKSCLLLAQQSHPDLVKLEPEETGRQIKIDQVRGLSDFIGTSAQQGGYRVIIINPADDMNISATNALLKGLEEPGENTLFMLISSRPGRLAATIRSRCQTVKVALPDPSVAIDWMCQQAEVDNPELLLKLTAGAPLKSLSLLDNNGLEQRTVFLDALKGTVSRRITLVDAAASWQKQDVLLYLDWLTILAKDLLYKRQHMPDETLVNLDATGLVNKVAARTTELKIFAFVDKIQEYRQQILAKTNPLMSLLLEDILISWTRLFQADETAHSP